MLTVQQIAACTGAQLARAQAFADSINATLSAYDITTPARQAAFLAQIGHESGGLRYVNELWGPTPAQSGYEGRKDLGNTLPGDGKRYMGHGLIQITGRANHAKARDRLRAKFPDAPDFEAFPQSLADPKWAALSAGEFWERNGCNRLADAGDFLVITKRINGGTNGLSDRQRLYSLAKTALGVK